MRVALYWSTPLWSLNLSQTYKSLNPSWSQTFGENVGGVCVCVRITMTHSPELEDLVPDSVLIKGI